MYNNTRDAHTLCGILKRDFLLPQTQPPQQPPPRRTFILFPKQSHYCRIAAFDRLKVFADICRMAHSRCQNIHAQKGKPITFCVSAFIYNNGFKIYIINLADEYIFYCTYNMFSWDQSLLRLQLFPCVYHILYRQVYYYYCYYY